MGARSEHESNLVVEPDRHPATEAAAVNADGFALPYNAP
jgi:hypothetical protein